MKMRKNVCEKTEHPLHSFGCQPHALNLLVKDVFNQVVVRNTTSKVIEIAIFLTYQSCCSAEVGIEQITNA